mmetsp:Transcript_45357/g.96489  ORF Transcript_45357/g.96489 Transcript_45357/m.96489 type:complete len:108 (-) Transcript_45357:643-966(-)
MAAVVLVPCLKFISFLGTHRTLHGLGDVLPHVAHRHDVLAKLIFHAPKYMLNFLWGHWWRLSGDDSALLNFSLFSFVIKLLHHWQLKCVVGLMAIHIIVRRRIAIEE